jgi:hypothetical protein
MYGPPLGCKRNVTKAVWSAQMYPASVEQKCSGHSMEYAALSSWILPQPRRSGLVSITGSRERWVRPFCHLKFRQQTWQILFNSENQKQLAVVAGVRLWKSRSDFQVWRPLPGVNCTPAGISDPHLRAAQAGKLLLWSAPPMRCGPVCWPVPRLRHSCGRAQIA